MACGLSAAECFRKYVVISSIPGLKATKDGWWSIPCPARSHGKPVRFCVGKYGYVHIYWTDLGGCPEPEVFAGLVQLGMPGGCLRRPEGAQPAPETGSEADGGLADAILGLAFGEGSATERLIRIALLAADGELPEGPMVEVFAANLRVSPASIYRATAEGRRKDRKWLESP